jgi:hypothetical protein
MDPTPALTPTVDFVPSPGATGSPPVQPWSTSACGSRGSWPVCARSVGTYVSFIHFLPRPEPWTRVSRFGRGPDRKDQGIPVHRRRNPSPPVIDRREACGVGTVYRSEHSKRFHGHGMTRVVPRLRRRTTQGNHLQQHPGPGSAERVRTQIGARPQVWKGLWTEPTVQGRRPT